MNADDAAPRRRRSLGAQLLIGLPLVLFLALAALLFARLYAGDPGEVPSALIGRQVPEFSLPAIAGLSDDGDPVPGFSDTDLRQGRVSVVNVWASWCVPCRDEHPHLVTLAEDERITLYGLNYKDEAENARRFLGRYGNPFAAVGADSNGRVGIDWGVYGVPETFVVDGRGSITYKHIGPIDETSLEERLMPAIEEALISAEPSA